jgi:putative tricarboxylic transport membrane protein
MNVKELVAYAKANPGKLSYGTAGVGAMNHVGTEWFKTMAGIDIVHVPYRGDAPVATDVMNGTLGVAFISSNVAIPLIKAGELRALAVSGAERVDGIDAPTLTEAGLDVEFINWRGVVGPPNLSDDAKQKLVDLVDQVVKSDAWQEQLERNGWDDTYLSGDEFDSFLDDEQKRIHGVLVDIGLVK